MYYSATCIVLYTHRCSRLNHSTASMRCSVSHTCNAEVSRTCDKQTSTKTNVVVNDTAYSSASAPSWPRTTGSEASESDFSTGPRTQFNYPMESQMWVHHCDTTGDSDEHYPAQAQLSKLAYLLTYLQNARHTNKTSRSGSLRLMVVLISPN